MCRVSMSLVTVLITMCVHRCTIIRCYHRPLSLSFFSFFLSFFLSCQACVRKNHHFYLPSLLNIVDSPRYSDTRFYDINEKMEEDTRANVISRRSRRCFRNEPRSSGLLRPLRTPHRQESLPFSSQLLFHQYIYIYPPRRKYPATDEPDR